MTWIVLKFIDTDEVEVVPYSWYNEDLGRCIYPPFQRNALEKAIKQKMTPPDDADLDGWNWFKASPMSSTTYENFQMAHARASKACFTSEISGSEACLPAKRIPIRKKRFDDTSDENSDDEPSLKGVPKLITKNAVSAKAKPVPTSDKAPEETCTFSQLPEEDDNGKSVFQRFVTRNLVYNRNLIEAIDKKIDKFYEEFKALDIGRKPRNPQTNDGIFSELPAKSLDEFKEICAKLEDVETFNDLARSLARLGGKNHKECIRRFLSKTIVDEVAINFTLHGHRDGKQTFITSKMCFLIIEAVKSCTNVTIKEIELQIALWLTKSSERIKKKIVVD
ncbi:unnamed protein product [Phaedon cochleariae]|uniref:DUF4806 domain-containing protein n=1 Tax=Phaedon cochleariae TaxID=80249 RepID=A0A9N9SJL3_PHACE|nr:unnamed protein product [Phaedon cochleariae]